MRRAVDGTASLILRSLIAVCCGVWLWVFLSPMEKLGLLVNAQSFLPVFTILVIAQLLPVPIIRLLAGVAVSAGYVVHHYGPSDVGFAAQVHYLVMQEWSQLHDLLHGNSLMDPLQTQLFLFAICVMYWLIVYASRRMRLWVFYNVLAVIVLGIVDGNTPVHPNVAIVMILFICILVLGMSHFVRLQTQLASNERGPIRFFAPLSALVVVTLVAGWVFPKQSAVWPNPAKLWSEVDSGSGSGRAVQMIGYQSNNSHLGGAFVMNHDPVLSVITKYPAYLRGEVYANYTGQGWTPGYVASQPFQTNQSFGSFAGTPSHVKTQLVSQQVRVLSNALNANVIFGAYMTDKVQSNAGNSLQHVYQVVQDSGTVYGPSLRKDDGYAVVSAELVDPTSYLSNLPARTSYSPSDFPPSVQIDLQLPPMLPERVHYLAIQVTEGAKNEYEMAKKIQDYLQTNYAYNTKDVPVPGANQDYVDQFLFDSKRGYCNNFSSSMAVMLRTLGIPTRWVTGFDKGTADPNYTGTGTKYTIENSDAHSWVEVYFPNVGWIPFDPTPSFSIPFLPDQTSVDPSVNVSPNTPNSVATPKSHIQPGADATSSSTTSSWTAVLHVLKWLVLIGAVLVLVLGFIFRQRIKEVRHRWVWRNMNANGMLQALQHLVKLLRRHGEVPNREHTLRDLQPVAKSYGIGDDEYLHLLRTAESNWYGRVNPTEEDVERVRTTWWKWLLGVLRR